MDTNIFQMSLSCLFLNRNFLNVEDTCPFDQTLKYIRGKAMTIEKSQKYYPISVCQKQMDQP